LRNFGPDGPAYSVAPVFGDRISQRRIILFQPLNGVYKWKLRPFAFYPILGKDDRTLAKFVVDCSGEKLRSSIRTKRLSAPQRHR
jgi:hypothetical protein